jgi:hypothetical protein
MKMPYGYQSAYISLNEFGIFPFPRHILESRALMGAQLFWVTPFLFYLAD